MVLRKTFISIFKSREIILKARKYSNKYTLLDLYYSFIYPYITYYSQVWGLFCQSLQWRYGHDGASYRQPYDCLLNRLFRRRPKKTSKLRVTGLCVWNSPATGEFPAQMARNAENVSIWWRHHVIHERIGEVVKQSCQNNCWYPSKNTYWSTIHGT